MPLNSFFNILSLIMFHVQILQLTYERVRTVKFLLAVRRSSCIALVPNPWGNTQNSGQMRYRGGYA